MRIVVEGLRVRDPLGVGRVYRGEDGRHCAVLSWSGRIVSLHFTEREKFQFRWQVRTDDEIKRTV